MVAIAVSIRHVRAVEDWDYAPEHLQAQFSAPRKIVTNNWASYTGFETFDAVRGSVMEFLRFGWREVGSARTVSGFDTVNGRAVDVLGLLDDMPV